MQRVVLLEEVEMTDNTQSEEFWVHHVVKDFDYIVSSGKYPDTFYEMLSEETKTKLLILAADKIYERTINGNGY